MDENRNCRVMKNKENEKDAVCTRYDLLACGTKSDFSLFILFIFRITKQKGDENLPWKVDNFEYVFGTYGEGREFRIQALNCPPTNKNKNQ